jgi:hypothetical protein
MFFSALSAMACYEISFGRKLNIWASQRDAFLSVRGRTRRSRDGFQPSIV